MTHLPAWRFKEDHILLPHRDRNSGDVRIDKSFFLLRRAEGWTYERFARELGISPTTLGVAAKQAGWHTRRIGNCGRTNVPHNPLCHICDRPKKGHPRCYACGLFVDPPDAEAVCHGWSYRWVLRRIICKSCFNEWGVYAALFRRGESGPEVWAPGYWLEKLEVRVA